jgi:acyl transferase domain-containing protein/D-arabinose 1-dehydrogenase-like Zn-dependent alcohol dehydrogenase/acyl carrier protein
MDPILNDFHHTAATLTYHTPEIPIISNLTGAIATPEQLTTPTYWTNHLRHTVRFTDTLHTLHHNHVTTYLEITPTPTLSPLITDTLPDSPTPIAIAHPKRSAAEALAAAVSAAYAEGVEVDWAAYFDAGPGHVELPTYPFQRTRYWLRPRGLAGDVGAAGMEKAEHALLGAAVTVAERDAMLLSGRISIADHPWLADHAILDSVLLPGTAFVELALHAADRAGQGELAELTLEAPLILRRDATVQLQMQIDGPDDTGARPISIYSRQADGDGAGGWRRHGVGQISTAPRARPAPVLAEWPPPGAVPVETDDLYDRVADVGMAYGPAFQGLQRAWKRGTELFAEAALPDGIDTRGFTLHPALLDAAMHTTFLRDGASTDVHLPFSWTGVSLHRSGATSIRVRLAPAGQNAVTVTIADEDGTPVADIQTMAARPVSAAQLAPSGSDPLLRVDWPTVPTTGPDGPEPGEVVFLGAAAAPPAGVRLVDDLPALRRSLDTGARPPAAVLSVVGGDTVHEAATRALALVQDWLADERLMDARLVLVTENAVAVHPWERVDDLGGTAVWGLARSAQTENPGRLLLVDMAAGRVAECVPLLGRMLASGEPQYAIRDGSLRVPRLVKAGPPAFPAPGRGERLEISRPGTVEGAAVVPAPEAERELAAGEIRVSIRAAGLNFRDVLLALGMYPGRAVLGTEGAGVVLEAGPGATGLAPGDRVMGMFHGCLGPVAVTDQRMVIRIPDGWSYPQAAAAPTVFLTAYYALFELAGLDRGPRGRRVLIHAAAGGVGMAATQLARHLGAEVFATAGAGKWATLRAQGLADDHIANSRTLDFAAAFRAVTGGAGMDVVLDSLAGEFVDASLRLVADGGRFLEMGKTDIRDADDVAARYPGVSYRAFDLSEVDPDQIRKMLSAIGELAERGVLRPLPITCFDIRQTGDALRMLSQARHIGKVVITLPRPLDPDGTVLITGGTGTLGALAARHLVARHGVRHLVLAGRRGPEAPGATELTAELAAQGASVSVAACDLGDPAAVAELLATIPALTAVIHAAGVVDDATIGALTPRHVENVLRPKADAAWTLHRLTEERDLAAFACYSSVAAMFGSPGQGNYAAANLVLDALAHNRRLAGLPATSLAWGLWADDSEMTLRLGDADRHRMERTGLRPLDAGHGLALLDAGLADHRPALVAAALDLATLRAVPADRLPPILHGLLPTPSARTRPKGASALRRRLDGRPEEEQVRILLELVRADIATVLGHTAPESIDPDRSFQELGFDSLTAVELRNRLSTLTGLRLPPTLIFDHPTATALTAHLRDTVRGTVQQDPAATVRTAVHADEPIAVVAMGCRFPGGVASPEDLWTLLAEGRDAISTFPADRGWDLDALLGPDPAKPGRSHTHAGGFIRDAGGFDAEFFGISPREALATDPQQRLLLETVWETLERAGIRPETLRGSATGVFVGMATQHYGLGADTSGVDGYLLTGNTSSVASGRVAYTLGLEGPAITLDTACSSSLVAVHLATQSLRTGECDLAIAGGVAVMATPGIFVEFSTQGGLAPDGRCKPFAAAADGTAWGEGIGLLLVERLSDAQRLGHPILARIRGTAINQDGASNGLTAPNGPSQQRVIRAALADANLSPEDIDAVEAHGTGTTLGDPIEAQALLGTYGQHRTTPLWLGSIKSNIGHTQAAAGVAGIIKIVQALQHGLLPKTLHADAPTPHVDWSSGAISLLTEPQPWPDAGRPRRAAVSSFGISGTNAHLILEQAPHPPEPETSHVASPLPYALSARSAAALHDQARRLQACLQPNDDLRPAEIAHTLATGRSQFEHRAVVVAAGRDELRGALGSLAADEPHPSVVRGAAGAGGIVFVFPGQGSQWIGMGLDLLAFSPVFADRLRDCADALAPHVDWSLIDVLGGGHGALDRVDVVQPALWAVMVSLAEVWQKAAGVRPDAVVGHSQGEIAAACAIGALSLEEAARVVALRSQALAALSGTGAMASIALPAEEVAAALEPGGPVSVAAVNGPRTTIVTGDRAEVHDLVAWHQARQVRAHVINVDYASHSSHVDVLKPRLLAELAGITPKPASIPFHSTVTGAVLDGGELDAAYWYRNLREPVQFERVTRALLDGGHRTFIETSPHPVLTFALEQTVDGADATVTGTLRRDEDGCRELLAALARAHVNGTPVDWAQAIPHLRPGTRPHELPTYPFQRQQYWLAPSATPGDVTAAGLLSTEHPLLSAALPVADGERLLFSGRISLRTHPWLADHAVGDTMLLPGTAYVEATLHMAEHARCPGIGELTLEAPLILGGDGAVLLQAAVEPPGEDGHRPFTIHSRPESAAADAPWTRHAVGELAAQDSALGFDLTPWPPPGAEQVGVADAYADFAAAGLAYGPAFQGLRTLWRDAAAVYAEVDLPAELRNDAARYGLHPALLDSALHTLAWAKDGPAADPGTVLLPFSWADVTLHATGAGALRVRLTTRENGGIGLELADETGRRVARIGSLGVRPTAVEALGAARRDGELFRLDWTPLAVRPGTADPGWVRLDDVPQGLSTLPEPVPELVIADLGTGPADDPAASAHRATARLLALLQGWLADDRLVAARLAILTHGAVAVHETDGIPDLAGSALWGMARSAQTENPDRFVIVDLDDDTPAEALLAVLRSALDANEPQVAVRAGIPHVPRLARTEPAAVTAGPALDPDGTVLITGGTGTLGRLVARHLARTHGVRRLLLLSRQGPAAPGVDRLRGDLAEFGADVTITACDVADPGDLCRAIAGHALTAVVHAAGTIDDATIGSLTPGRIGPVLRPKADAAWHLHQLTRDRDLSAFVLFSSAAGVLGSAGQGNYAAANTFLDALAQHRRALGLHGLSLAWGLWAEGTGMTRSLDQPDHSRIGRGGLLPLPTEEALALLDEALAAPGRPLQVAARVSGAAVRAQSPAGAVAPLLSGLFRLPPRRVAAAGPALADRLAAAGGPERHRIVLEVLVAQIAAVLGHPDPSAIDPERAFQELGFDSLTAVDLRNRLTTITGLRLPATLVFDYPTANALAGHLLTAIGPAAEPAAGSPLDELDRLEDALAGLAPEDVAAVAARLRALAARWSTAPQPAVSAAGRLDAASPEELFDFIDKELGRT